MIHGERVQVPSMMRGLTGFIVFLLFITTFLSADASAGPLYRWVDEKGVTHMSDSPPERHLGQQQMTEVTPGAARGPIDDAGASPSKEFVARSSQWMKDPLLISDTVITIRPVKDRTYRLTTEIRGTRRGDGDGMGHSIFMGCVVQHFAASKGYNGWREAAGEAANSGSAQREKNEIYFTLVPSSPGNNAQVKDRCRTFIRPRYLWNDAEVRVDTTKPICRKLVRILADHELNPRKKVNKGGLRNVFEYAVDVDGDGRKDMVTEKIVDEKTNLTVQLADGKRYTLDEDGYIFIVNLNGKEHVFVMYTKWDRERKRGHSTGHRLYELTKDRPKLVCDREDLKELLN
jgi:hypothetical protein